jgi:hypothetical protein
MSHKVEPIAFVWSGAEMVPLDRYRGLASRQFRPGVEYSLIPHRGRSEAAHGLYFKALEIGWKNLPEEYTGRFPTAEYLRKWCLVQEGYADEHSMLCDNNAKAMATAALCRALDGYAVIKVSGPVVTVWTAKSQSHHAMGHDVFNDSMNKVLERVADMLGISSQQLTEEAKSAMTRQGTS